MDIEKNNNNFRSLCQSRLHVEWWNTLIDPYMQHMQQNTILTFITPSPIVEFMKLFLNASEVAKLLNVDRATVSRWVKKKILKNVQRPTGTQSWRIPLASYEEL